MLVSSSGVPLGLKIKFYRGLAALNDLPPAYVGRFNAQTETVGVELRTGSKVLNDLFQNDCKK
jgi:hypothetical protein